jgi:hypothetical protein
MTKTMLMYILANLLDHYLTTLSMLYHTILRNFTLPISDVDVPRPVLSRGFVAGVVVSLLEAPLARPARSHVLLAHGTQQG